MFSTGNSIQSTNFNGARSSGAYRLATELRQHNWDIEVIDFFDFWSLEELKLFLSAKINLNYKFIGFSHIFPDWTDKAESLCVWIKQKYPWIIILSGAAGFPHDINSKMIDIYMQGYGEYAIIELFEYLFANKPRPKIIQHKNKNIILANENSLASPWRNPIILYEDRDFLHPNEWLGIEFSRGCKFKCSYCSFPLLGVKGDWTRDADNTERQLRDAHDRFGITQYYVSDETFNDRTEKITKFADVVERLSFKPIFTGYIRPDLLHARKRDNEELLRMNFFSHYYGVESFNPESRKAVGKGYSPDKLKEGLLSTKEYFLKYNNGLYRGTISLIYGLPFETEEQMLESYKWLIDNWQGQSYLDHVLNIPKRDISEIERAYNISKMTLNYQQYGYTELHPELVKLYYKKTNRSLNEYTTRMEQDVLWRSDITNILRCYDLFNRMQKERNKYDFRLNNYEYTYLSETDTLKDRLDISFNNSFLDTVKTIFNKSESLARNYINKKLSTI
jgi:radical SAM superfamily enzyme YgiQ (UPF0313 family)